MSKPTLYLTDEVNEPSVRIMQKFWTLIRAIWIIGSFFCAIYLAIAYLLPITGLSAVPQLPLKLVIEVAICMVPVLAAGLLTSKKVFSEKMATWIDGENLFLRMGKYVIATSCFEISSVHASSEPSFDSQPKYNTTMLLAMRAGMGDDLTIAYEVGISQEQPFLRVFITARGDSVVELKEILKREATRTEAIFLSSLDGAELRLLNGTELEVAVVSFLKDNLHDDYIEKDHVLLVLDGIPQVAPSERSSQIGSFLSTVLRQGYSASFTCVFSSVNPKKERRKLEREWKTIREKEKRKDDSLADQAAKKRLVGQYEEVQGDTGWFEVTSYLLVKGKDVNRIKDALRGLALSIWGGDGSLSLRESRLRGRTYLRLLTRRHLKSQRMHVSKLAAYVNMPAQQIPVITSLPVPSFPVPSGEIVDNELVIGNTVFSGRNLSNVGLKVEWLREHVAVLGATGTGKTTLVKHLIAELSRKTDVPWWIFDVKGSEYKDLVGHGKDDILLLNPGVDPSFIIDLMDAEGDSEKRHAYITFSILRELLKERSASSELTPAMEKLLRVSVEEVVRAPERGNSISALEQIIYEKSVDDRVGNMTRDALLNRLEILSREPLGSILGGGPDAIRISSLMSRRVIFDLRHVARVGGMDAARLIYNLVAKRIFDYAMRRGINPNLNHVVVLEEASNLVPESYTRDSAADITTGESMVMLQRATGQGVIVVSTRPNISSNILANTATKIAFRLPFDSAVGARFMSLDDEQEKYLRVLKCGRALMALPGTETFEISTKPFIGVLESVPSQNEESTHGEDVQYSPHQVEASMHHDTAASASMSDNASTSEEQSSLFDRLGELANHIVAFLASKSMATESELHQFLTILDSRAEDEDIAELIRDFLSLETIEREALSLVPGGFLFTLPGRGLDAIKDVIMSYIIQKLPPFDGTLEKKSDSEIIINDRAILILPEHLRAASMDYTIERIRRYMTELGNQVAELILVVRGSVAAAMLREHFDKNDEFSDVSVVSAFSTSLDSMVECLKGTEACTVSNDSDKPEVDDTIRVDLIGAVHELGSSTSRAIQMRLWFGLMQDFVDLSNGCVSWDVLLEFIETTAAQTLQGRSAPMSVEDGRRALTELLADEVLIALRTGESSRFIDLETGLWVVTTSILDELKRKAISVLEDVLMKQHGQVSQGHGYYDLCAGEKSFVVFPTQQQLNTLLNLHSDVACRKCNSKEVVCILTAAEYVDDSFMAPENLKLATMDEGASSLPV
ncbi:MAG: DUF87 domain-containing protein [Candidatus Thorarchaeota archaeon]